MVMYVWVLNYLQKYFREVFQEELELSFGQGWLIRLRRIVKYFDDKKLLLNIWKFVVNLEFMKY